MENKETTTIVKTVNNDEMYKEVQIAAFDKKKPVKLVWNKDYSQLIEGSNLPWVVEKNKNIVVNPMILSDWLKNGVYKGKKVFTYKIAKGVDGTDKNKIFFYNDKGVYIDMGRNEFEAVIRRFIPQLYRNIKVVNEVYSDLICNDMFIEEDLINADEDIINFEDGIYNIKTKKILPHSSKYLTTIQIKANIRDILKSDEESPVFDNFMDTLCIADSNSKEIIMECMGLAISNIYGFRTKKALFMIGDGNSGKSQVKRLVEELIGTKYSCTDDLKNLDAKFGTSGLYGKRLYGSNDMKHVNLDDMNVFKQITGGDRIPVEFKFGAKINYLFKGFTWIIGNQMPSFGGDKGKWVYERMMIIRCDNVIPENKRDKMLCEKMLKEKNAIIKKALEALDRLITRDFNFELTEKMLDDRSQYEVSNNPLITFVEEFCEVFENKEDCKYKTPRGTFYNCFYKYCHYYNNDKGKLGKPQISKILKEKYNEEYYKTNGAWYMSKIAIRPEIQEELLGKDFMGNANKIPEY